MARLAFRDFSKYLNITLPEDEIPANALRRARGVHSTKTQSVRSRWGSTHLTSSPALSVFVFNGELYSFTGTYVTRNDIELHAITGSSLSFLSFPPRSEKQDYLFMSNGDNLHKMSPTESFTGWGITAPANGFTATAVAAEYIDFLGGATVFVPAAAGGVGTATDDAFTADLTSFTSGTPSTDADYITFEALIDYPNNLQSLQLDFSLGNNDFSDNTLYHTTNYTYTPDPVPETTTDAEPTVKGLGSTTDWSDPIYQSQMLDGQDRIDKFEWQNDSLSTVDTRASLQSVSLPVTALSAWTKIRIAKSSFTRSGTSASYNWADIQAYRFVVSANANGPVNVTIRYFQLLGGVGTQGDYKYFITYYNSETNNRSNPNSTAVVVKNVLRQEISLTSLPVPTDTQITHVEIWRTIGDGAIPFFVDRVAAGTTSYSDRTADIYVMDPRDDGEFLSSEALTYTNIPPYSTFGRCASWQAAVFWTNRDTSNAGNLYYSSTGYAESNEGFIRVTNNSDPLQQLIVFNGTLFAISQSRIFRITGTNPYYAAEVYGVPGTVKPDTVVGTPYGIFYQAVDGIRLFNGIRSERVGLAAIGKILLGESSENLTSFTGECATFGRGEYFISDGTQTLVYNPLDDTWRDFGTGFDCFHTDPQTGYIYAGNSNGVYQIESPGTYTDGGDTIPFSIQTKQIRLDVDREVMVNHLFLDADTSSQSLTVTLVTDKGEVACGIFNTASRQRVVIPIGKSYNRIAVRLTGELTEMVEVFGIELDADVSSTALQSQAFQRMGVSQ
jgi:hypothetical protein